jgi:NAD(P)-dependent dehydrogenase (short-subunit alcohol dehydrogenase family)
MADSRKSLLVLGASSDVARATALAFCRDGWDAIVCGRDLQAAQADAADLALRAHGSQVTALRLDILDTAGFVPFLDSLPGLPDAVLCAVGLLGDQTLAEHDLDHAVLIMRSNFEGPSLLLGLIAARFAARGRGTIIGISSVAGERGRASNYVYGAAKAGFSAFLSGLRNRLSKKGVHVLTVKPGFMRTRMTAGMTLPAALTAEPPEVGAAILKATRQSKDVIYIRPVWRWIMTIIKLIPEGMFKKRSL